MLGLGVRCLSQDLCRRAGVARVADDVESADLSRASSTPTFFLNGRRHHGAFDLESLSDAVRVARAQAMVAA